MNSLQTLQRATFLGLRTVLLDFKHRLQPRAIGILLTVLVVGTASCTTAVKSTSDRRPRGLVEPANAWEQRAKAHASFAAGLLSGLNGDMESLNRFFEKAHAADPSNEELA